MRKISPGCLKTLGSWETFKDFQKSIKITRSFLTSERQAKISVEVLEDDLRDFQGQSGILGD